MNVRRSALALGLGVVAVLLWLLSSTFGPARASTNVALSPTPPIDSAAVPRRLAYTAPDRRATDDPVRPELGGSPLAADASVILNGDFENGRDGSWEVFTTLPRDIIVDTSILSLTVGPHGGDWAAWLDGDDAHTSYVSQTVTLPVGAPTLGYWYWIDSEEDICGWDFAWVRIDDTDMRTVDLCKDSSTGGWVSDTIALDVYAGQTVSVQFLVVTDDSYYSAYFIDDVTLGGSSSTTYLPLTLSNY